MSQYQPFILSYLQQRGVAATPENIAKIQRKMDAIVIHELDWGGKYDISKLFSWFGLIKLAISQFIHRKNVQPVVAELFPKGIFSIRYVAMGKSTQDSENDFFEMVAGKCFHDAGSRYEAIPNLTNGELIEVSELIRKSLRVIVHIINQKTVLDWFYRVFPKGIIPSDPVAAGYQLLEGNGQTYLSYPFEQIKKTLHQQCTDWSDYFGIRFHVAQHIVYSSDQNKIYLYQYLVSEDNKLRFPVFKTDDESLVKGLDTVLKSQSTDDFSARIAELSHLISAQPIVGEETIYTLEAAKNDPEVIQKIEQYASVCVEA
jgi:hypothetical protein